MGPTGTHLRLDHDVEWGSRGLGSDVRRTKGPGEVEERVGVGHGGRCSYGSYAERDGGWGGRGGGAAGVGEELSFLWDYLLCTRRWPARKKGVVDIPVPSKCAKSQAIR